MRDITDHLTDVAEPHPYLHVMEIRGAYFITTDHVGAHGKGLRDLKIEFQEGPVEENGVNGITTEALLAVIIDRLRINLSTHPLNEAALEAGLAMMGMMKAERLFPPPPGWGSEVKA